jgi:FtsP/CotA-like multicopper oxidase with cupredoxin domain
VQGDVVQATVGFQLDAHTIHWHGIEPTPLNDGVGHTSFEATSSFVYQFATNTAGTYFYHCHKNTVLHFEMGLYGGLIVDPLNPDPDSLNQAPYPTGGPGFASANVPGFPGFDPANFVVPYDVEAVWAVDSFDSIWHLLNHDAFMQKCDANDPMAAANFTNDGILNVFRPDVFLISGVVSVPASSPEVSPEIGANIQDPRVAINAKVNQTVLIRLLNADYLIHENILGLDSVAIAADGHPFGVPPLNRYSAPVRIPAGRPFRTTSARRYDLLVRTPAVPGIFPFRVKFIDWISGKVVHIARTVIKVQP